MISLFYVCITSLAIFWFILSVCLICIINFVFLIFFNLPDIAYLATCFVILPPVCLTLLEIALHTVLSISSIEYSCFCAFLILLPHPYVVSSLACTKNTDSSLPWLNNAFCRYQSHLQMILSNLKGLAQLA